MGVVVGLVGAYGAAQDEIAGQVLDSAGKPVAGIAVSPYWISDDGRWATRTGKRTDADGKFAFRMRHVSGRLMTLDATRMHGAIATFDTADAGKPLILRLRPTTLVRAAYTNEGLGHDIEKAYVS